jgi:hypothetical protein
MDLKGASVYLSGMTFSIGYDILKSKILDMKDGEYQSSIFKEDIEILKDFLNINFPKEDPK